MSFITTHMGLEILPVATYGDYTLYRRAHYRGLNCPKYVIFRGDLAQKEIKTKREAIMWIKSQINTPADLDTAVDRVPEKSLREFVKQIAHLWYVNEDGNLDADQDVNGGDAVEMISQGLTFLGIQPTNI